MALYEACLRAPQTTFIFQHLNRRLTIQFKSYKRGVGMEGRTETKASATIHKKMDLKR